MPRCPQVPTISHSVLPQFKYHSFTVMNGTKYSYTQDSIVLSRIFGSSTDTGVFKDFLSQLLRHCGRWPEPKSVLVVDDASFSPLGSYFTDVC
ncbi:hypothetical protein N7465_007563 [Penicillium sp. CMV-2018d]|nr:hypothetical protein N7465_007563 [Penicillium sp. CMV-2018d]